MAQSVLVVVSLLALAIATVVALTTVMAFAVETAGQCANPRHGDDKSVINKGYAFFCISLLITILS